MMSIGYTFCFKCDGETLSVACDPCSIFLCGLCADIVWVVRDGESHPYIMCRDCIDPEEGPQ